MIRPGWLAILALVLVSPPCQAQRVHDESKRVQVEMIGGQSVHGELRLAAVVVENEQGHYEIKPHKVKTIRFPNPGAKAEPGAGGWRVEGTVITTAGTEISGMVEASQWTIATDLGTLTPNVKALKTVTFIANQSQPDGNKEP